MGHKAFLRLAMVMQHMGKQYLGNLTHLAVKRYLRQGPMCDLGKGTSIIVDSCRIIKVMCFLKTLVIKISK